MSTGVALADDTKHFDGDSRAQVHSGRRFPHSADGRTIALPQHAEEAIPQCNDPGARASDLHHDQRVAELQQAVAAYRSQVDQLKMLRDAHAADAAAQPWVDLRARQTAAQQALATIDALASELDRAQEKLRQTGGLRDLLVQRLAAAEQQLRSLETREASLVAAMSKHEQAVATEAQAVQADAAAAEGWRAAREALALARQEDNRRVLAQQEVDARTRAAELDSLLGRANSENERAANLKREAAALRIEPRDLTTLREQHAKLAELQIRQAAVATRVRFDLQTGAAIQLDAERIVGQAERLLLAPTVVTVQGVGSLHVAPGGSDLAELAQAQARLHDEHQALLQRLGLASVADAEARDKSHAQRLADADAAEKARKLLAPKGLDALRADLDAARARECEASSALAQLPDAPEDAADAALQLDTATRQHDAAQVQ